METRWWNSGTIMVEQWKNDGGTMEKRWWNSGTMMVEEWNRDGGTVKQWNSDGAKVDHHCSTAPLFHDH